MQISTLFIHTYKVGLSMVKTYGQTTLMRIYKQMRMYKPPVNKISKIE